MRARRRIELAAAALLAATFSSQAATLSTPIKVVSTCGENTAQALFAMNAIHILRLGSNSRLQRFLLSYERCSAAFVFMSPVLDLGDAGWTVEPLSVSIETHSLPHPEGCVTITGLIRDDIRVFCFDNRGGLRLQTHTGSSGAAHSAN